jgi:hypothetical protein
MWREWSWVRRGLVLLGAIVLAVMLVYVVELFWVPFPYQVVTP